MAGARRSLLEFIPKTGGEPPEEVTDVMPKFTPLNLKGWIDEHRHLLKPPVGNAQVWKDREFIVMIVGGPNQRTDWHIDPAEEFFYQIEGDMILKIMEDGKPRDMEIKEGEIFLLPGNVPHSPQRKPNTVGLVVERARCQMPHPYAVRRRNKRTPNARCCNRRVMLLRLRN